MSSITHNFALEDVVWVINPTGPALFQGTIKEITLTRYKDSSFTLTDLVTYTILLANDKGTLKSTEYYMRADQADCLTLLATLADAGNC